MKNNMNQFNKMKMVKIMHVEFGIIYIMIKRSNK